jgi:hypothetical protein
MEPLQIPVIPESVGIIIIPGVNTLSGGTSDKVNSCCGNVPELVS